MARFYGYVQGERGEATRLGHRTLTAEARGWHVGGRLVARDDDGRDVVDVYATAGSSATGAAVLVGTIATWRAPTGDVYRRRSSADAYQGPDGAPVGARWEGGPEWFARFYVVERSAARALPRVRPR